MKKKIFTIATAHLDTCWLWTYEKTIRSFVPGTFKENFRLFEKFPDYKFNFEGSNRYEIIEEYYPEDFEKLKKYVRDGRWNPCGSCYENGDVNTPSPEALTRNILYGNGYFREQFGVESNDIFLPDCFGFGRALPSIAAHSGLTGFSTQKLTWGGAVDVPFDIGKWQGKDGKYIWCALKPGNYVSIADNLRKNKAALNNLKENTEKYDNPRTFLYHGNGDRGGAPAKGSVAKIMKLMKDNHKSDIEVTSASTKEFFDELENMTSDEKAKMPVYEGELLLTEHGTGSYTSRTVTKRWNRRCELLADAAEKFSVGAMTRGLSVYPQYIFDNAWKKVILHQFHDDITGTSFEECYQRSHNDYVQAMNSFSSEYTAAVGALSSELDTSFVKGIAVVVSNPVASVGTRTQAVSVDIDYEADSAFVRVFDREGNEVPSQLKKLSEGRIRVTFMAEVASCSLKAYDVQLGDKKSGKSTELSVSESVIENKYLRVTIDEKGDISSVYNKLTDTEALSESIKLALRHDVDSYSWPSWEVKQSDFKREPYMYPTKPRITIEDNGPALCSLRIERKADKSAFTQIISLDAQSDYVSVENEVDWRQEASILKAEFHISATNEVAQYDIGFGYTERKTNTERLFEVPAQKWAGITDKNGEYGTAIFSDSRAGWDKPDASTLRLTCIHTPLNSYRWECSQHLMDLGINRFGFAVYPHKGESDKIIRRAEEFCQPMHTFITDKHEGELSEYSAVKINCDAVRVSAVKKAQNSDRVVIRVCEYTGNVQQNVTIELPFEIEEAFEVRGDEVEIGRVQHEKTQLKFDLGENQIRSFAVTFKSCDSKISQKTVKLPYNANAITENKDTGRSTLKGAVSIPRELLPESVVTAGVKYEFSALSPNVLVCKGQTLSLEGGYDAVSFLVTSLDGDRDTVFLSSGREHKVTVQDCFERVGMWDLMRSRITAYIKPNPQLMSFSHTHGSKGDMIAKQMYLFGAEIPLGEDNTVTLPDDESIIILAATLIKNKGVISRGDEHFDTIEKRDFDYSFSSYALKASEPAVFEKILDKFIDRTYSPQLRAGNLMYSKLSPGDLYYYLRDLPAKLKFPLVKKKALGRKFR